MTRQSTISSIKAGLLCRCPRCGQGSLFRGFLSLRAFCPKCRLDYSFADPADGPAFFVGTGIGLAVVTVWGWWALTWQPPIWQQLAFVVASLLLGCLSTLRPVKAWLVAEQYINKAGEGLIADPGRHGEGGFSLHRHKARPSR